MDYPIKNGKWFETDQAGIDELKNQCFNNAKRFSYFRKGEWSGILDSIANAEAYRVAFPAIAMGAIAIYPRARQIVVDAAKGVRATASAIRWLKKILVGEKKKKNYICRRVICSKGVPKVLIAKWEKECGEGGVAKIPKKQVGQFKYIVSDQMWAIFTRFGLEDLRGVKGTDKQTIEMLQELFDREFALALLNSR